jgi:hypothetical protein
MDQGPRPSSPSVDGLSPLVFGQTAKRLFRAADVESAAGVAAQDVDERHTATIGGPGRVRTDDLFHAMELTKSYLADGKDLNSRTSRQKRLKSARFDTKSDTKLGPGADSGGSSPHLSRGGVEDCKRAK